ncbi:Holliday junction resolvase-like protein [Companilactobacillus versmoldensis DSM 14857 = KCTC 3814]|uniref:Putative pre-16S rRNA nuclease n=1 Tax=Companilactobacillus versmoldensis DSM 14857 = KCTC 3814 TaxID=1423815 RepID=A0A0R1SC96_9LACO|nr:Holliday junction resolvase-like protein [Companilactobacillus versmoldensis DSM 14857 = KCTC 3814]
MAVSDLLGWTAQGVEIIRINEDKEDFGLDRLEEIINEKKATGVVIGLPKNMNNTEGPRAEKSREYGKMVTERFELPVDFTDERLTTVQAERMLVDEANVSRRKRKKVIDKIAAEMILQNYLDAKGKLTRN